MLCEQVNLQRDFLKMSPVYEATHNVIIKDLSVWKT